MVWRSHPLYLSTLQGEVLACTDHVADGPILVSTFQERTHACKNRPVCAGFLSPVALTYSTAVHGFMPLNLPSRPVVVARVSKMIVKHSLWACFCKVVYSNSVHGSLLFQQVLLVQFSAHEMSRFSPVFPAQRDILSWYSGILMTDARITIA